MDDVKEEEHENETDDDAGIEQQKNEDRGIPQVFAHRGSHPFGQRMKHFRAMRGYSQAKLAKAVNTTVRVISYYENESPFVLGHFINRLCDVLQVSADDLMATTPLLEDETQRLDTILITTIIRAMNLPDPKKKTLNQIIDAYLEEFVGDRG